ncbi:MAG TPA: efflux transporter periplasmic adaptor subunit, partial [Acidobacteriaceae bacterium]|nr:efflux transporter periplasmic adaptor subunit [Acidobacteriaceae bacterium]
MTKENYEDEKPPISGRKAALIVILLLLAALVFALAGIVPRLRAGDALQKETDALAVPNVVVAKPVKGAPAQEVVLPGNMQAYTDSGIYARTDGYLKKWYFDIGS